jgi:hypothetical protein
MTRGIRILHLEDEKADAELVAHALREFACTIECVSSREAFQAALEDGRADLILSDFALPGFDGLSALRMVREKDADRPFIFVSGTIGEQAAIQSLRSGATDYVLKHRLTALPAAVERAMRDIDNQRARRTAEQALHAEQQFLRAVLESVQTGIMACDARGRVTLSNRAAREILGLPEVAASPEVWSEHCTLFQTDGTTPLTREESPLHRALDGEQVRDTEVILGNGGGGIRTVLVTGQAIQDAQGASTGAVVAMHDITEHKALEEQLRQSQKMEAVGQLAGGVAHDFNNLLNVITGYSGLLANTPSLDDRNRARVDQIVAAAHRAAGLTRQLLLFSRRQIPAPRVLALQEVLGELQKMLHRLIGEDVELITEAAGDLGRIKADPGHIEQIIMNLVVNARDAMPDGGRLTIRLANARIPSAAPKPTHVLLSVQDTGTGIPAAIRDRIFEPFFTTKPLGKGTGLGLAMIHGIVKQSGGTIELDTETGVGTTFRVYFPLAHERGSDEKQALVVPPSGGSERILVVEDEEGVRSVLTAMLQESGYQVIEARAPEEAIGIASEKKERIDLLVTDVIMPGMNGFELASRITARRRGLRVLFISGYTDVAARQFDPEEPGFAFLHKPFSAAQLTTKIREILDRSVAADSVSPAQQKRAQ